MFFTYIFTSWTIHKSCFYLVIGIILPCTIHSLLQAPSTSPLKYIMSSLFQNQYIETLFIVYSVLFFVFFSSYIFLISSIPCSTPNSVNFLRFPYRGKLMPLTLMAEIVESHVEVIRCNLRSNCSTCLDLHETWYM